MPISADFTVDTALRTFKHTAGTSRYTAQAIYSYLADYIDETATMDDKPVMSAQTPNEFTLTNGWFIDDASFGYIYEGAIKTIGLDAAVYTDGVYRMSFASAGYVAAVAGDIGKTVTDGTRTGTLLAYDNTARKWWVRRGTGTAWAGAVTITTGTGAGTITGSVLTGEDVWANFYNLPGTLKAGGIVYIEQNQVLVPTFPGYASGDVDQLVRVTENGSAINSRKVSFFSRDLGDRYSNFEATASASGGRKPLSIETEDDTNDDASGASVAGVTIAFGATSQDIGDGAGNQPYDVIVDGGGNTALNTYRRLKYLTRVGNTTAIDSPENLTEGRFYLKAQAGYTAIKAAPFGTFAGSIFFGARGVWLTNVSDPNNRSLIDANGVVRTPPVTMTVTVSGVVSGDRVLVARSSSGVLIKNQFTLNGVHTASVTLVVNEVVANDIPTTGVIRVGDNRYTYSGLNRGTKTFSGLAPAVTEAAGALAYCPLIDDVASSTSIVSPALTYVANFEVTGRVRKYAAGAGNSILPFENTVTVTSSGASISAIRTVDPVAT